MKQKATNAIDKMKESYVFLYSLFFIMIFIIGFKDFFIIQGKSFIWSVDGISQHFPFLYDWSEIVKGVIENHQSIPLWSWQIGLGGDVMHSYSYYVLGDPLSNLIALLFPLSKVELAYSIMVVVRLFLTGISLLIYCKYMGIKQLPSVIGSLMYAFSGHVLFWGLRHPFFINPAIILPILLISVEEIFKKKKSYWFILCIAFSAMNSFYFFYMNSIAIFVYSVVRFFYYVKENRTQTFVKTFIRVSCHYILGLAMASIFFIPAVYGFLNTYRVPTDFKLDLSFDLRKYIKLFYRFAIIDFENKVLRVSLGAISFPSILLFLRFKDRLSKSYRILFVTFTIFLCLPFMHSVFNGFSAPNDRWVYIYICIICFIVAYTLNKFKQISNKIVALWALLAFGYLGIYEFDMTVYNFILVTLGTYCFVVYFFLHNRNPLLGKEELINKNILEIGILLLVTVNLVTNVGALMSQENYGSKFANHNSVIIDSYKNDKTSTLSAIKDDEFYRVEYENESNNNKSVVNNFSGAHIYNSIIDKDIIEFYNYYKLRTKMSSSAYLGFDEISALQSLMAVKYYVASKDKKHIVPYGFQHKFTEGEAVVYENQNYLSLGFVYYDYMSKEDLSSTSEIDRIYAMMDSVVTEDNVDGVSKKTAETLSEELEYEVVETDGVELLENKAIVSKKNGSITLEVKNVTGNEVYLLINRIYFQNENQNIKVMVETSDLKKTIETRSVENTYYSDNRDYLYNLGYTDDDEIEIQVSFSRKGEYEFEKLAFWGMEMKKIDKKVEKFHDSKLEQIKITNDKVSGKVSLNEKGILFLSIPHSSGWKAYVDGKEVETMKVNIAFTGIVVDEGNHEILLIYKTPYLVPSMIISLCGIFIFVLMWKVESRKLEQYYRAK